MIPNDEVARLLLDRCAGLPLPVAFPEHPGGFSPPADGKYYEVRFFPNNHAWEGVSTGLLGQGLLQVNVVWPKGKGIIAPHGAVTAVKQRFPKDHRLFGDGVSVKITNEPSDGSALPDATEVRVAVTIAWSASEGPAAA